MDSPQFSKDVLAQMRLSQLRELARRLGVGRYSSMLRLDLLSAIQGRVSRMEATPADVLDAPAPTQVQPYQAEMGEQPAPQENQGFVVVAAPAATPEIPISPLVKEAPTAVSPTWIVFQPLDPQWAVVRWGVQTSDRERALAAGGEQMALRITDVTDTPDQSARPHTLQEVLVDANAQEWHIPIPLGDRDYRVELGYRTSNGGWFSLGLSSVARMPADVDLSWVPFAPFAIEGTQQETLDWGTPLPMPGLHERLYQQSSSGYQRVRLGSEAFHEEGAWAHGAAGGHLSGAGPWASGREASGAGLAPRQRSFWLVADAELIVYGATDPSATLTIAKETMPLSSEGTFSLHMAFPDGDQNFPIEAVAADGEQKRSITMDFRRSTPHAHVNSKENAVAEWF